MWDEGKATDAEREIKGKFTVVINRWIIITLPLQRNLLVQGISTTQSNRRTIQQSLDFHISHNHHYYS